MKCFLYQQYGQALGIQNSNEYVQAMKMLEKIDLLSTNDLPNVGFCWVRAWLQGGPYTWMNTGMLNRVRKMYDAIGLSINTLRGAVKNMAGQDYLSFFSNRIEASSLYLQAIELGSGIQQIKKDSVGFYSIQEKEKVVSIFNTALLKYDQYMEVHAKMMPDRGTEGTLISLWHGSVYGLMVLRKHRRCRYGCTCKEKSTDAPPLPILMKK